MLAFAGRTIDAGQESDAEFPFHFPAKVLESAECGQTENRDTLTGIQQEVGEVLRTRVVPELERLACHVGECKSNPATSCAMISDSKAPSLQQPTSGIYWIRNSSGIAVSVFCDFQPHCAGRACNGTAAEGWIRLAYFDMTDPSQNCPAIFDQFRTESKWLCGKRRSGCISAVFPSNGVAFSRVCGRVIGYQQGEPDAFKPLYVNPLTTIDDLYVDGVSITHGKSPRDHIWTFAAAQDETQSGYRVCPCTLNGTYDGRVPDFIGSDYTCETGSRTSASSDSFYGADPLWDGQGCGQSSSCCDRPPGFCKELGTATTDDLELRLCSDSSSSDEGTPLELVELYVQ